MIFNDEIMATLGLASQYIFRSQQPITSPHHSIDATADCSNPPVSCSMASLAISNTCCTNSPGGLLLQTQFWDTHPASGPADSWTVHGLWPDNCDGTYEASCDGKRNYRNISAILNAAGATDLVSFMREYWKDEHGRDEVFWEHEWNKHGTCISTIEPRCYGEYEPLREVVDYFNATIGLFQTRDSYALLQGAGIVPDHSNQYPIENVLEALAAGHDGFEPALHCRNGELNEIWWYFNTRGSLRAGDFVPTVVRGSRHDCPHLVRYLPKRDPGDVPDPDPEPPGKPFSGRGKLLVEADGDADGCVISYGTWFHTRNCAKFTAEPMEGGFSLRSRRGYCGVRDGVFGCGKGRKQTMLQGNGSTLTHEGSLDFYADEYPSGHRQAKLYTGERSHRLRIHWKDV